MAMMEGRRFYRQKADGRPEYLIWSHEQGRYWAPGSGYVSDPDRAGRFTRERALELCRQAIPGTASRLGALPELPVRHEDVTVLATEAKGLWQVWATSTEPKGRDDG